MKVVALISGGKDSFFNIHHCVSRGHELVALGNLHPGNAGVDEIDSFMFQTVGHEVIDYYSECIGVPLYRQSITGTSANQTLEYSVTKDDEIEDLFVLLSRIQAQHPDVQAVSCGAILSHYQRTRVENVCDRLGLTSLCYLWQRPQYDLMQEMCLSGLDARLIKVAAIGLTSQDLEKSLSEMLPKLVKLNKMYDVHICGEGGEFESLVLDSPLFKKRLQIVDRKVMEESNGEVSYVRLNVEIVDKPLEELVILDPPPLLEPQFAELYEELFEDSSKMSDTLPETIISKAPPASMGSLKQTIVSTPTKLFVSNLSSDKEDISEATKDIFSQLTRICEENELTLDDVQHVTLLLPDISQFQLVNKVYQLYFEKYYLPPSRICVETCTPSIELSCIVLKNNQRKQGIHIRSRSYWAPQNIGPYSQAIVEERYNSYKLATLSGQIPLVPSSMELTGRDPLFNALLSLQHLYRVSEMINVREFASVLCFIVDERCATIITRVWEAKIEESNRGNLVVLKVSQLPRGADVEWGGISYQEMHDMYEDDDEETATLDFDEVFTSAVKVQQNYISTAFSNKSADIENICKKYGGHHIKVIASPVNFAKISTDFKVEYLAAQSVFNYKAEEYKYAVIVSIEQELQAN